MEDLAQELARIFAAEQAEHLAAMRAALAQAAGGDVPDLRELFRHAHSLKGAARAADRPEVETIAHALETLLEAAEAGGRIAPATVADARQLLDAIEDLTEPAPVATPEQDTAADDLVRVSTRHLDELQASLRVLREELDERDAIAGTMTATRGEIDAIRRACSAPGATLAQIAGRLARLHAASIDIATRRAGIDQRVGRTAARVQADAERVLLVPAVQLAAGLERMVREVAVEAGKSARLIVADDGTEADRRMLQRLRDPLTQILRNAIGHGIEVPGRRRVAGKPEEGEIRLSIRSSRGALVLIVEDDGAGPDAAAIRAAAASRGLIPAGAAPGEAALFALVFEHGVSTAGETDRLSGRGVGLSVVADAVRRLNGTVRMRRAPSGGARLSIVVPLTAARFALALVEVAGRTFAIPARIVSRLDRIDPAEIVSVEGMPSAVRVTQQGERPVPIVTLAHLLGLPAEPAGAGMAPALLIERDERAFLLVVDVLSEVRALAIGDPSILADAPRHVLGVAAVGEGRLALVLAVDILLDRLGGDARGLSAAGPVLPAAPARPRTILVVDDSITTRTLQRGILEGQGYRVLLCVDGLDALERLRTPGVEPDLIVADVEMPRMDGFALLAALRNDPALARIPVIMMTSRDAPDDVQRGLDLGANAYVTKQSFEQGELLATIRRLI